MKTIDFETCLSIFRKWDGHDSDVRDELFFNRENFPDKYIIPFRNELYSNVLNKKKLPGKIDIIKFYVSTLNSTAKIRKKSQKLNIVGYYDDNKQIVLCFSDNSTESLMFRIFERIFTLYTEVFNEIQQCCNTYDIPFIEICKEVQFPLNTINYQVTIDHQKNGVSTSPNVGNIKMTKAMRPYIDEEYLEKVFDIFKKYFYPEDVELLRQTLETFQKVDKPLLFTSMGIRLADAFKRLINAKIILHCEKKDLQYWISENFQYLKDGQRTSFKLEYLNNIISSQDKFSKDPILHIKKDVLTDSYILTKT